MFNFPWSNFHELNLDWILAIVTEAKNVFDNGREDIDYAVDTADEAKTIATQAAEATIADNSISTSKLQNGAVTNAKLALDSVTTDNIVDRTITGNDIAENTIESYNIKNGTIIAADIANDAITTEKLADGAVTYAKIFDDSVNTSKITDAAVTTAKIADNSVTLAKMADNSVGTAELVDASVTYDKLAQSAINGLQYEFNGLVETGGSVTLIPHTKEGAHLILIYRHSANVVALLCYDWWTAGYTVLFGTLPNDILINKFASSYNAEIVNNHGTAITYLFV